jgi:PAS domain S-box-containing protein
MLEAVLAQLPAGVMIVRADGTVEHRNERYRQTLGRDTAATLDDNSEVRASSTEVHRIPFEQTPLVRALREGEAVEGWSGRLHPHGKPPVDVIVSAAPLRGPHGEVLGAVSVMADVTAQKEAARALRRSEEKLRLALQAADTTVVEWEVSGGRVADPRGFARWLDVADDTPFATVADMLPLVDPADIDPLADKINALMRGGQRCETVFRVISPADGRTRWVLSRSAAGEDDGRPTGTVTSVLVDVTDRYTHLDRLRLLESAVVHARDAVVILEGRPQGGGGRSVLYANDAFCRMTGYTAGELTGRSLHFLRGPDSDENTLAALRDALDGGQAYQCELLNYRKGGSPFWVELSVVPVPDPSGRCSHWVMIQRDVSDRKVAEAELRHSREVLAEAQRIAHIGSWEYQPEIGASRWSEEEYRIFGVDPSFLPTAEGFLSLVHPDDRPRVSELQRATVTGSATADSCEFRIIRPSGEVRHIYEKWACERGADGTLSRMTGVSHDITDRKQTQEQLIQAQKMELIGQMAGGIAHDFNNMLTGLLGHVELIRLPAGDPNRRLLDTVQTAAQRATKMSKNLLGLARKSELRRVPVALGPVVAEVTELVGRTCDPRIELVSAVGTSATVEADLTFLHQVLLNLCLNACDAMPHGGRLSVAVDEHDFPPDATPPGRGRRFVRIRVEDTGVGMPAEVRAKIFEPFYTTKGVGKGTGLGLAMVQSIIEQHRGWVECESEVDRGTRFDVFLPRCELPPEPPSELRPLDLRAIDTRPDADTPMPASGRVRTVLVVDDEPMIRDLARAVLETSGYRVLEAHDGEHAVEVFRNHRADIDLVVLDLTMPRMSGRDTFRALVELSPTARVMFSSGYSADDLSDTTGIVGMLPKPYRPVELLTAVGRALA